MDRILDYIIEQSDRYDGRNMQFEQDILSAINRKVVILHERILRSVIDISSLLSMQQLLTLIEREYKLFIIDINRLLLNKFNDYYDIGHTQMDDLIQMGKEISNRLSQGITEVQYRQYDENSIAFIRDHALNLIKGHSSQKIEQLRAELGNMFLNGKVNKATVRNSVEKILNVNKSKAEEIAQTELSTAYNHGALNRLTEYQRLNPNEHIRKYWHGFKFSNTTCTYCRPRIGQIYDLSDSIENLPAHIRCRCVWLPVMDGWDTPVGKDITLRANMSNMVYNKEQLYSRINNRLGINYGNYIDEENATKYINGNRSQGVLSAISNARESAIIDKINSFNIAIDTSNVKLSKEFNSQMGFWKKLVSGAMVDNNTDLLERSFQAIKGVMILPWNPTQLGQWNDLLNRIDGGIK